MGKGKEDDRKKEVIKGEKKRRGKRKETQGQPRRLGSVERMEWGKFFPLPAVPSPLRRCLRNLFTVFSKIWRSSSNAAQLGQDNSRRLNFTHFTQFQQVHVWPGEDPRGKRVHRQASKAGDRRTRPPRESSGHLGRRLRGALSMLLSLIRNRCQDKVRTRSKGGV